VPWPSGPRSGAPRAPTHPQHRTILCPTPPPHTLKSIASPGGEQAEGGRCCNGHRRRGPLSQPPPSRTSLCAVCGWWGSGGAGARRRVGVGGGRDGRFGVWCPPVALDSGFDRLRPPGAQEKRVAAAAQGGLRLAGVVGQVDGGSGSERAGIHDGEDLACDLREWRSFRVWVLPSCGHGYGLRVTLGSRQEI
jgi:hypothetical protein